MSDEIKTMDTNLNSKIDNKYVHLIIRLKVLKNKSNELMGTILKCYGLIQNIATSRGHEIERNNNLEQTIKNSLNDTEIELNSAENMMKELKGNDSSLMKLESDSNALKNT